jgi:hypothetical protein
MIVTNLGEIDGEPTRGVSSPYGYAGLAPWRRNEREQRA